MWFNMIEVSAARGKGASVDIGGGTLYLYTTVNKSGRACGWASAHGLPLNVITFEMISGEGVGDAIGHGATVPLGVQLLSRRVNATGDANQDGDATILVTFGIDEGSPQGDATAPGDELWVDVTSAIINEGEATGDATAPGDENVPFGSVSIISGEGVGDLFDPSVGGGRTPERGGNSAGAERVDVEVVGVTIWIKLILVQGQASADPPIVEPMSSVARRTLPVRADTETLGAPVPGVSVDAPLVMVLPLLLEINETLKYDEKKIDWTAYDNELLMLLEDA